MLIQTRIKKLEFSGRNFPIIILCNIRVIDNTELYFNTITGEQVQGTPVNRVETLLPRMVESLSI